MNPTRSSDPKQGPAVRREDPAETLDPGSIVVTVILVGFSLWLLFQIVTTLPTAVSLSRPHSAITEAGIFHDPVEAGLWREGPGRRARSGLHWLTR